MLTTHAYALGDRIELAKAPYKTARGPYRITALMPESPAGEPQYGIRAEGEGPERVITESEILIVHPQPKAIKKAAEPPGKEAAAKAERDAAKAERQAEAKSAWNDYVSERDAIVRRTAELRELRLKAEEAAAARIAALARNVRARQAPAKTASASPKGSAAKPAAKVAAAKPAVKAKVKAPVKAPAKVKAAAKKPAQKAAKSAARPKAKSKLRAAKTKAKAKARSRR